MASSPASDPVRFPLPEGTASLLALALDQAHEAVFGTLRSGRFYYVNEASCRALGYSRDELLGMSVGDIDPDFPVDQWPAHWEEVRRFGSMTLETRHRRKDGSMIPVEVSVSLIDLAGEERMFAYARDISTRKAADAALRDSKEKFHRAFEASPDALTLSRPEDGTYLEVGEGFTEIFGWTAAEAVGRTSLDLGIWVDAKDRERLLRETEGAQSRRGLEFQLRRKDGSVFPAMISCKTITVDGARCLLSVTRDITERKEMEEALRESEGRLRTITDNAPDTILLVDREARIQFVNRLMPGLKWSEVLGSPVTRWVPEAQREMVLRCLQEAFDFGERREYESEGPGPDGMVRSYAVRLQPVMIGGRAASVVYTATDITERNAALQSLQESEARYRRLFDSMTDACASVDLSGRITEFNEAFRALLGRPAEEIGSLTYEDITPARWHEEERRILQEQVLARGWSEIYEKEYLRGDARVVPVELKTFLLRDADGNPAGMSAIIRDITERKRIQEELQATEARLHTVVANSQAVIFQLDPEGRFTLSEGRGLEGLGLKPGQVVGQSALELYAGYPEVVTELRRALQGHSTRATLQVAGMTFDNLLTPVLDCGGRVASVIGIATDITESRRMEDALRESEARFRTVFENEPECVKLVARDGTLLDMNPAGLAMLEVEDRAQAIGGNVVQLVVPEWRAAFEASLERVFCGETVQAEFEMVSMKGTRRRMETHAVPLRRPDGAIASMLAVTRDVTARRRVEEDLRASELRFSALFVAMTEGVALMELARGPDGRPEDYRILDVNPSFEAHMGISAARATGTLAGELFGLGHPPYLEAFAEVAGSGRAASFQTYFPPLEKHLRIGAVALGSDRFAAIFEDITEQLRSLEALRESEASYRGLFDSVREAIYIQDREGRSLDVNQGAVEMYGYLREEFIGRTPEFLSAPGRNDLPAVAACVQRAFAGEPQRFEFWGLRKNGEAFLKDVRIYPGTYFGQEVVCALAMDISERRRGEEALRQAQKLESLGVLAGGIAHDFNNLLTAMLGNLNLAQLALPEGAQAQVHLDAVERTLLKASDLTKQMLAYSGKGRFTVKVQDLNRIVQEMVHLLQVSVSKKAELRLDLHGKLPTILAEAAQVQQVVMNLVTNASDALGTQSGAIRVATFPETLDSAALHRDFTNQDLEPGEYVVLEVCDTGCGIPADVLDRIFDPFFTTKTSGRGLGLSALLGILRGHKAGFRIRSDPGRGSTFQVLFPACGEAAEESPPSGPRLQAGLQGTVLLVDDEEMILESTGMALEALGLKVELARDGVEGLERFLALGPELSLVLMDLSMPRMDGATAFLAMHQARPEVPVLLSSGYDPQEPGVDLMAKGLAGFIQKPYRLKELAVAVGDAIGRKVAG